MIHDESVVIFGGKREVSSNFGIMFGSTARIASVIQL
jgi:hypothetical protein